MQLWDFFSKGLKNMFKTAVIYKQLVFEQLRSTVYSVRRLDFGLASDFTQTANLA